MFHIKSSFILIFVAFYIELSVFEDLIASAKSSHRNEFDDDLEVIRAVKESMRQFKERKESRNHRQKRETNVVCYGDLGCFEDSGPFGYIDTLPSPPEEIDTKFYIYSSKNRSDNPFLQFAFHDISKYSLLNETLAASTSNSSSSRNARMDKNSLKNSTFDPMKIYNSFGNLSDASMRVIVHGFGSSCPHEWITEMRNALMAVEECFVMCIDWEKGSALPNYVRAAANTRLVGKQLAFLLKKLNEHNDLDFNLTHIIGFSLGAHASGFAGAEIKKIRRITGLDPAGPLFEGAHVAARLDETDAEFVDVIHSNGENLILGGLGSWQPMGHVDFYPNGGRVQTGCQNLFLGAVTDIAGIWSPAKAEGRSLCNHRRAYKFFIDSVAPRCLFPSFPCDSYENFLQGKCFHCPNRKPKSIRSDSTTQDLQIHNRVDSICGSMGYYADKSSGRGQLYLRTRDEEPFCAHQYNLKVHSSTNDLPIKTLGRLDVELESDGGLTEAFTLTERDDQELFVGDFISKIIVPHPALNFPKKITLTYQVYRGWLTRGLSSWSINKVILSDSFGESYSLCRNFILESGKPQHMTLEPGDCYEEELQKLLAAETSEAVTTAIPQSSSKENLDVMNRQHIPLHRNSNSSPQLLKNGGKLWKKATRNNRPNITTKSLETNEAEPPMIDLNLGEVLLSEEKKESSGNEKRSFSNKSSSGEDENDKKFAVKSSSTTTTSATAAALNSGSPRREDSMDHDNNEGKDYEEHGKESSDMMSTQTNSEDENKFVTVQLFQYRLGDVFERAEKYARNTLFPLLSEQISSIFNFEQLAAVEGDGENESTDSPIVIKQKRSKKNFDDAAVQKIDLKSLESMGIQVNSAETTKPVEKIQRKRNFDPRSYELLRESKKDSVTAIFIDLPTYRPETFKHFIPLLRNSDNNDDDDY